MSLVLGVSKQKEQTVRATLVFKAPPRRESVLGFSRWTHFALVLIPTVIAQAYLQLHEYLALPAKFPEWLGYTGYAGYMARFDYSPWSHVFLFVMFLAGLGGALALLYGISKLEKLES